MHYCTSSSPKTNLQAVIHCALFFSETNGIIGAYAFLSEI
jgi:hypothetical protein